MHTWQLTGKFKAKIHPLIETMYGFESTSQTSTTKNWEVVVQLKTSLDFCYKVYCLHWVCATN